MSIVLTEPGKRLEIDILGYEFPDAGSEDGYFEPNWLLFQFACTDSGETRLYEDASMLTFELRALYEDIGRILSGEKSGLVTDFMEPYLTMEIVREDTAGEEGRRDEYDSEPAPHRSEVFAIYVRFVYDTDIEWKTFSVSRRVTRQELENVAEEMKKMYWRYPQRGV